MTQIFESLNILSFHTQIMAGNISLEGSIRTCKIDTGYADRVYSDRFQNPGNMVCSVWNGYDSTGRQVCPDSFMTKAAGCNSALDRVFIENTHRPKYIEYISLSSGGIDGDFYGSTPDTTLRWNEVKGVTGLQDSRNQTGNFGLQLRANVNPGCGVGAYDRAMRQTDSRYAAGMENGCKSYSMKSASGF